ncbi:MAG: sulfite exporter TauE/SafE family protein [Proteobacteria bacterium]|nr:sulfite exporter TauE/SafE family protein [Burkholderiales bacterium]
MIWIAAYLASGAVVGFLAGLLGIGGGMTLVPILSALFAAQALAPGYSVHLALGTAMASAVFTSLASVREYHRLGSVDWQVVRTMVPGLLIGALAATVATGWVSQRALALFFALVACLGATQMLRRAQPVKARARLGPVALTAWTTGIGAICGLMSAGGAFLTVPFMVYCGVPVRTAIATSAALAWPMAVVGTIGYVTSGWSIEALPSAAVGFVWLPALAALVVTSMLFAPIGARLMHRLPVSTLKRVFALLLYGVAAKMALAYW